MSGTSLYDLDKTDIDTLLPWYFWKYDKETGQQTGEEIVYREGKPYKKVAAKDAGWIKEAF